MRPLSFPSELGGRRKSVLTQSGWPADRLEKVPPSCGAGVTTVLVLSALTQSIWHLQSSLGQRPGQREMINTRVAHEADSWGT